jgi:hypothetical protein
VNISGAIIGQEVCAFPGSVVNMTSGEIGGFSSANAGSVFNISGGRINRTFFARAGSMVNISGGTIEPFFSAFQAETNISGGNFLAGIRVFGGVLNFSGGTLTNLLEIDDEAQVNIWGALPAAGILARQGVELNLFGTEFYLDDKPIAPGEVGKSFEMAARDVTLSGILADGSSFSMFVKSSNGTYVVAPGARLTITFVPEPATCYSVAICVALVLAALKRHVASPCPRKA